MEPRSIRMLDVQSTGQMVPYQTQERLSVEPQTTTQIIPSKRAQKLDPRNKGTFRLSIIVGLLIILTAGVFSFATVADSANWMKPSWEWLIYVVPGFIELIIVFSYIDYMITRQNNALLAMVIASVLAVVANAAHTISEWGLDAFSSGFEPWVGTLMSAAAPLAVLWISKRGTSIAFVDIEDE